MAASDAELLRRARQQLNEKDAAAAAAATGAAAAAAAAGSGSHASGAAGATDAAVGWRKSNMMRPGRFWTVLAVVLVAATAYLIATAETEKTHYGPTVSSTHFTADHHSPAIASVCWPQFACHRNFFVS